MCLVMFETTRADIEVAVRASILLLEDILLKTERASLGP
jgi:hypothetical protein